MNKNMTPEQKEQWLDAAKALLNGEPIEYHHITGQWFETEGISTRWPHRRKPAPDPLAEIKAAHAAGKRVQYHNLDGTWNDALFPDFSASPDRYRIAPWTLPEPPAGQQWHRTDWTEGMLPEGWRPMLLNEIPQDGDEFLFHPTIWTIQDASKGHGVFPLNPGMAFHRTRRPLPPPPRMVPLTRADVPLLSVFRSPSGDDWFPSRISDAGVHMQVGASGGRTWDSLQELGWLILRPGDTEWRRCEKPAP